MRTEYFIEVHILVPALVPEIKKSITERSMS